MLHILLLILKIIGIILAAILGILVLLFCVVLFTPFKYKGSGACDGTIDGITGEFKLTWFFHLLEVRVNLNKRKVTYYIRIAWKKLSGQEDVKDHPPSDKESEQDVYLPEDKPDGEEKEPGLSGEDEPDKEESAPGHSGENESDKKEGDASHEINKLEENQEKTAESSGKEHEGAAPEDEEESGLLKRTEAEHKKTAEGDKKEKADDQKKTSKLQDLVQKCKALVDNIKCTFIQICDKIKALSEKKEKIMAFIQNEAHKNAFTKGKKEVFRLLKKLKPKKLTADVRFGLDDPYRTGQVLAVFAAMYPFTGPYVRIQPDFEHRVLEGEFFIKGRIRACYFAVLALRLIMCKAVRTTIKDVKNFEL